MDTGTANLLEMLSERVLNLTSSGRWREALYTADAAVQKARNQVLEDGLDDTAALAKLLEIKGDVLRQMKYLEDARITYLESLELTTQLQDNTEILARLNASIGALYDHVENDNEAIRFYERSIDLYARAGKQDSVEVADICNNLGYIYRSLGDLKNAESLLLRGLSICHHTIGDNHERTATICNNLGALYLKLGHNEQAREMHTMALETRSKIFGKKHPETAQSYGNLALAQAQCGESADSRNNFEQALRIYEHNIASSSYDYAAVAENYVEFLKEMNDTKTAASVLKKAQRRLARLAHPA